MSRSSALYQLQQLDSGLDDAQKRIQEIELQLKDTSAVDEAAAIHQNLSSIHEQSSKALKDAEHEVAIQNSKLEGNQKKLYGGAITNPKELEDLQLESTSLSNYLQVLEERQLEAMLASDQSRSDLDAAAAKLEQARTALENLHQALQEEKRGLETDIKTLTAQKTSFLEAENLPDLSTYESLRNTSGGIAVTRMVEASCTSCGANIPSAIEQAAKSPSKLAFCPTCNRILHPD